jgi:hypothetical protein
MFQTTGLGVRYVSRANVHDQLSSSEWRCTGRRFIPTAGSSSSGYNSEPIALWKGFHEVMEASGSFVTIFAALPLDPFSGATTRTVMKCAFALVQESACFLVSKNRSMTIAFRSASDRPHDRAAFRLTTAGPVSTATHVASANMTLLPYGIFFGSTAQCPSRKRAPFQQARSWPSPRQ